MLRSFFEHTLFMKLWNFSVLFKSVYRLWCYFATLPTFCIIIHPHSYGRPCFVVPRSARKRIFSCLYRWCQTHQRTVRTLSVLSTRPTTSATSTFEIHLRAFIHIERESLGTKFLAVANNIIAHDLDDRVCHRVVAFHLIGLTRVQNYSSYDQPQATDTRNKRSWFRIMEVPSSTLKIPLRSR